MEDVKVILSKIKATKDCIVTPPINRATNINIPKDLKEFYSICNGVELFIHSDYPYKILGIENIEPTDLKVIGKIINKHPSMHWYNIADDFNGDFLSIDLSHERFGWCYDSHYETYGLIGQMPVIAKSFTEMLNLLYKNKGECIYWFEDNFRAKYSDAYDF